MRFHGFTVPSLIDFPGRIALVAFAAGCSFRCPACHAREIAESDGPMDGAQVLAALESRAGWVDGIVVCGGEPTLQDAALEAFIRAARRRGVAVKLDTNGSRPDVLSRFLAAHIVDYVAMDVKAPPHLYAAATGTGGGCDLAAVEQSLKVAARFPRYEFRTTLGPVARNGSGPSLLTSDEMVEAASWVAGATGARNHHWFLQRFRPAKGRLISPELESFPETTEAQIETVRRAMAVVIPSVKAR